MLLVLCLFFFFFAFRVTTNKHPISVLQWDVLGKYLLIADICGNVQLWIQKDNLISEWIQLYQVAFPGEHIIKAIFFHNGKRLALQTDKKDIINYMDKFQRLKFSPSVRAFGGVPANGILVVTATGLLGAILIPAETASYAVNNQVVSQLPYSLLASTRSLGHTRIYITAADICYARSTFIILLSKIILFNSIFCIH